MLDPMHIVYHDDALVVVEKASGFLSAPGRGEDKLDSVSHRVTRQFDRCIPQPAVHRLDMDTSGLMVLALTQAAHRHLSTQFQERRTGKHYVALLDGCLRDRSGTVTLPFRLDVANRPRQIYDPEHGKVGITHWRVLEEVQGLTRVQFTPVTGRTHQLRVHAAHEKGLGTPIVGDRLYGSGTAAGQMKLHATRLAFTHPVTGASMAFESPPAW